MTPYYVASGPVRGDCPHRHETPEAADRCAQADRRECSALPGGCYSDRSAYRVSEDGSREPVDLDDDDDLDPEPPADDVDIEALAQALYLSDAARVAAEDALRYADRDDVTMCVQAVELVERLTGLDNVTVPDLREALPLAAELEDADAAEVTA